MGDAWGTHCCGLACHASVLAKGSSSVFAEGQAVGRIGDPVACGSAVAQGSMNVFAG
ncbi:PAAR domain-containing protein [Tepidimonas thermarum]|nr:PAAR domain-containing protein [Tepidimonas thermarum]